nr:trichohyalin-like [Lytechinus pictus]
MTKRISKEIEEGKKKREAEISLNATTDSENEASSEEEVNVESDGEESRNEESSSMSEEEAEERRVPPLRMLVRQPSTDDQLGVKEEYRRELEDAVKRSEEYIKELQKEEVKRFEERQEELLSQEKQDAELARQLAKEEPDEMIYRGERVHVMREQVLKDEELARRIQMTEQSLSNTPTPKSPDIIILPSSGGSSRKNSASSSTIKCLSIEKFMSPMSRKSRSPEGAAIEDQPSTSAHSPGEWVFGNRSFAENLLLCLHTGLMQLLIGQPMQVVIFLAPSDLM